jgi:hypothetical protein
MDQPFENEGVARRQCSRKAGMCRMFRLRLQPQKDRQVDPKAEGREIAGGLTD